MFETARLPFPDLVFMQEMVTAAQKQTKTTQSPRHTLCDLV